MSSVGNSNEATQRKALQKQQAVERTINYTELRTLKQKGPKKPALLAGLEDRPTKQKVCAKQTKTYKNEVYDREVPKLLQTAVSAIKQKHSQRQQQAEAISSEFNKQLPKHDSIHSKDNNHLHGSLLGSKLNQQKKASKKKLKTHQTNKSRLSSISSELNDNASLAESSDLTLPVYRQKGFKLYDNLLGQSEAVFVFATGKERKVNPKLIYNWKDCLLHEDKNEVFIPTNPQQPVNIPYTFPRVYPLNELEKGFQEVYGVGKQRYLRIGEESLIIEEIERYLRKCDGEPMKIARKDFDIISDILADCKLPELQNYPVCYKQIEGHLKLMATRWKYLNIENKADKSIESALINGKNNFVDLGKAGPLSEYLLKNSNMNEFI